MRLGVIINFVPIKKTECIVLNPILRLGEFCYCQPQGGVGVDLLSTFLGTVHDATVFKKTKFKDNFIKMANLRINF